MAAWHVLLTFSLVLLLLLRIIYVYKQVTTTMWPTDYKEFRNTMIEKKMLKGAPTNPEKLPIKLLIVGLAKDILPQLKMNMEYLLEIGKNFERCKFVIVENDSTDGTTEYLQSIQSDTIKVLSFKADMPGAMSQGSNDLRRFQIMAFWRNKYIEEIRKPEYDDFTHVLISDLDHSVGTSFEHVKTCFERADWDMVSANGTNSVHGAFEIGLYFRLFKQGYYDTLAYRDVNFSRVAQSGQTEKALPISKYRTEKKTDVFKLRTPFVDSTRIDWMPVTSAFGGMTIYRKEALVSCTYGAYDCEHIAIHDEMIEKGFSRMFINPRFLLFH